MEKVYDEVCALFPGTYIHIGGDECPKKRWKECPKCQIRIKALGLGNEDGLQACVTRHFTEHLAKKGRRAVGWDEILAGNPGTETVVHNWRKPEFGIKAAEKGHDVIICSSCGREASPSRRFSGRIPIPRNAPSRSSPSAQRNIADA